MKKTLFLIACLCACHKKDRVPAFSGPLTFERIAQARTHVHLRDDWDDSVAAVEAEAGPATSKTAEGMTWALSDGASCASMTIEHKSDHVGTVGSVAKINKSDFVHEDGSLNTFEQCEALAKH